MDRCLTALLAVCALLATSGGAVLAQEGLDLELDPDAVAQPKPEQPSQDLNGASTVPRAEPHPGGRPHGWKLRPTADVDLKAGEGPDGGGLGDLELDVNSLGVRLKRAW